MVIHLGVLAVLVGLPAFFQIPTGSAFSRRGRRLAQIPVPKAAKPGAEPRMAPPPIPMFSLCFPSLLELFSNDEMFHIHT
jgi:hypothetical protein